MKDLHTSDCHPLSPSGTVSWIQIGDTHLTRAVEQNAIDLARIVDEINEVYAPAGIDFVYVPGDIADDVSIEAYRIFRKEMDRLKVPWTAILGDHDVHQKSFANFQHYVTESLTGAFSFGPYRFLRLNAFAEPRPDSFLLGHEQLTWLKSELKQCEEKAEAAVLFLHCYPSDLKQDGAELTQLLKRYPVLLVAMGHTHYNEISNDGCVLYTATRSTGQVEEGPVGYSITTIDQGVVSWHFAKLGSPSLVAVTSPGDERLLTDRAAQTSGSSDMTIRAKIWLRETVQSAYASIGTQRIRLTHEEGVSWSGQIASSVLADPNHSLEVVAQTATGNAFSTLLSLPAGTRRIHASSPIDQENAIKEWRDRGILGTQLGPNKNGRKW